MRKSLMRGAGVACSFALLVPLCCWADLLGERVSERNFRRVEVGMTGRQVEAILGGGQTAHYLHSGRRVPSAGSGGDVFPGRPEAGGWAVPVEWYGDMYSVVVWFDEDGLASGKGCWEWVPRWSWQSRRVGEKVLRFLRLENGPPRGLGEGARYNGMPVGEWSRPFAVAGSTWPSCAWWSSLRGP